MAFLWRDTFLDDDGGGLTAFLAVDGCGGGAKLFPVIAVVTDEVCDLAEGLVHDGMLEGHGEIGSFWRWMKRDVDEDFLFFMNVCVGECCWCVWCKAGIFCFLVICASMRS